MAPRDSGDSTSLYLHYLDRELGEAYRLGLEPRYVVRATRTLLLATASPLYCGISAVYENELVTPPVRAEIELLLETNNLDLASHQQSRDEFLESRRSLYRHDAARYPNYFGPPQGDFGRIAPTAQKVSGTTAALAGGLMTWASGLARSAADAGRYAGGPLRVAPQVVAALGRRDEQAVTYAYFRPHLGDELRSSAAAAFTLRRRISQEFTNDYLRWRDGDIATGVRQCAGLDAELSRHFPRYDLRLLWRLLYLGGLSDATDPGTGPGDRWRNLLVSRRTQSHELLVALLGCLLRSLHEIDQEAGVPRYYGDSELWWEQDAVRRRLDGRLVSAARGLGLVESRCDDPAEQRYLRAGRYLEGLAGRLVEGDQAFAVAYAKNRSLLMLDVADVLLLTATEVERRELEQELAGSGYGEGRMSFGRVNAYRLYGPIAGATVAVVQSSMGSGGPGGSALTANEAIGDLRASRVIAVGIAFSMGASVAPLGTLLVSSQVHDYEAQRVGAGSDAAVTVISRGDKAPASPLLLSRIRSARLPDAAIELKEGLLLSGAKLVDNIDYREQLRNMEPEAIGGEMEASGVYSAASRAGVDWVVMKAVCDFADGNKRRAKKKRQQSAARQAARACVKVLEQGGLQGLRRLDG